MFSEQPGKPEIGGYESGQLMAGGSELKLSCVADAGKPSATLIWYESNKMHPSLTELKILRQGILTDELPDGKVSSTILISLSAEKNGKYYFCGAINEGFDIKLETLSNGVQLNVAFMTFPGANLTISSGFDLSIQQPHKTNDMRLLRQRTETVNQTLSQTIYRLIPQWHLPYIEMGTKQSAELFCQSGLANPPANIIWRHWKCPKSEENISDSQPLQRARRSAFPVRDLSMDKSIQDNCVPQTLAG
ncbi:nephrosis 1, congenital, Finnish type (nephrin) [Cichlidogyrus casuarinus]|uniref:Nephrosis 1, congenital, Finnish type (Nephrin) n=1 Tax=Cichlidogyrus casuarinus TaxID=1844966 RepID=A0ABD2Q725_9PLAT